MSLHTRLTWWSVAMLTMALLLVLFLSYREMVVEQGGGHPEEFGEESEPLWWQLAEVASRAAIPLLILALCGWFVTRRALRPLQTLTAAAARIPGGNLEEQIPISGRGDELDHLTAVFNDMTARLSASFNRIREFTLHANHELKTPLAILRAEIGEMLDEQGRSESDKARLASQLDEIERLTRIVNGLTLLTRADANQLTLNWESVALDALLREAAENCEALAEGRGVNVSLEALPTVQLKGDRHRLRQLLLILCDNAVKYNRGGGNVKLSLEVEEGSATVRIQNTGPGIPESEQSQVFQRFHRGASAAAMDIEGCGLGLSIALSIAQAHHGALAYKSRPEDTEFALTLPAH
jgi:signal transduction histidine kinase